jgi:hypothetical protein
MIWRGFGMVLGMFLSQGVMAQEAGQPFSLGLRAHYGFLWPHRPSSWVLVEGHAPAFELFAERQVSGAQHWHHDYLMPSYGMGLLYSTMANPGRIGAGVGLKPFMFLPFVRGERSAFGIRLGWGIGYIVKAYDRRDNTKQIAIGSRINTAIQLMPEYRAQLGRWAVTAGVGIDHWSNGSFQLPNLGLNYLSIGVGAGYALAAADPASLRTLTDQREAPLREWSVVGAFGINETGSPLSGQYTVYSLSGQRSWAISHKSALSAGADLFNKGTLAVVNPELADEDRLALTQFGVHGGYALLFGKGEMFLHMGVYVYTPAPDEAPVYQRIGIRYRTGRHLLWNMSLKSHYAVADHWEFGVGYRWD